MNNPSEEINPSIVQCLLKELTEELSPYGFDISPFLSGWYNAHVSSRVQLGPDLAPYDDCLCICLISNPQMFEKTFLPTVLDWCEKSGVESLDNVLKRLKTQYYGFKFLPGPDDPFDWSVFIRLQNALHNSIQNLKCKLSSDELLKFNDAKWIPDYAIKPVTLFPYVHVQTAGHVSGMAYFHQPNELIRNNPYEKKSGNYSGVSLHPYYGGWFGFRGIYIFPYLQYPTLVKQNPLSPIYSENKQLSNKLLKHLLYTYNSCWNENQWRNYKLFNDSFNFHCYSSDALAYFTISPLERVKFAQNWFTNQQENKNKQTC
ncbi:unnamed protein product [Schistosoma turkestanicum]|nr:unnamed protein product [Schistosoma turkestanicum]